MRQTGQRFGVHFQALARLKLAFPREREQIASRSNGGSAHFDRANAAASLKPKSGVLGLRARANQVQCRRLAASAAERGAEAAGRARTNGREANFKLQSAI
jgi:hypothetical protein